jgi:hypothetical protein
MKRMSVPLALSLSLVVLSAAWAGDEGNRGPRPARTGGEITKVDAASISIMQKKEGGPGQEQTYKIDQNTKVLVQSDEMETVEGEGGRKFERSKWVDGKVEDLKAGQRVNITYLNDTATKIELPKPPAPKAGGEGDRREEAKPPKAGEGDRGGEAKPPKAGGEGDRAREKAAPPKREGGEGDR